jgi:hypothetical protein
MAQTIVSLLDFCGIYFVGLFAGAAYITSTVDHPGQVALPPKEGRGLFRITFPGIAKRQAAFAFLSLCSSVAVALVDKTVDARVYYLNAGAMAFIGLWTNIALQPINRRLRSSDLISDNEVKTLLESWGKRHWARTIVSMISFGALLANKIFR